MTRRNAHKTNEAALDRYLRQVVPPSTYSKLSPATATLRPQVGPLTRDTRKSRRLRLCRLRPSPPDCFARLLGQWWLRLHPRTGLGAPQFLFSALGTARGLSLHARNAKTPCPSLVVQGHGDHAGRDHVGRSVWQKPVPLTGCTGNCSLCCTGCAGSHVPMWFRWT